MRKTKKVGLKGNFSLGLLIVVVMLFFLFENQEDFDAVGFLIAITVVILFWYWRVGLRNKKFYLEAGNLVVTKFLKKISLPVGTIRLVEMYKPFLQPPKPHRSGLKFGEYLFGLKIKSFDGKVITSGTIFPEEYPDLIKTLKKLVQVNPQIDYHGHVLDFIENSWPKMFNEEFKVTSWLKEIFIVLLVVFLGALVGVAIFSLLFYLF